MGQKVHPKGIRLGYTAVWDSKWFASRASFPFFLREDFLIRNYLKQRFSSFFLSKVSVERVGKFLTVYLYSSRPGSIIGKKGQDIDSVSAAIKLFCFSSYSISLKVVEIKNPDLDAILVSQNLASQLERGIGHKRAMRKLIDRSISSGALGIKLQVSGRLGGNEIARTEWVREGRVPLQTFRANIEYGFCESNTKMGKIGVKVWLFKKEVY